MLNDRQLQRLFRYGYSLTADETSAYDLLQDAVEALLRAPPRQALAVEGYVRTIMRNRFYDRARRQKRFPSEPYDDARGDPVFLERCALEDVVIAELDLDAAWRLLEPLEREILYLWAIEDLSTRDIALALEMPRGTVLARIHRLRGKLEQRMGRRESEAGVTSP